MPQHTVLIADRSEAFCKELHSTLHWICDVQTCCEGGKALSLLSSLHPDVLLLDLMLPGLDGISLLKALTGSGAHPVILATTCLVSDYILEAAEKLNVNYLLVKPCDTRATAARIQEQLSRLEDDQEDLEALPFRISGLLMMMGFSPKLHGFRYLKEAISRALANPEQSITKELYPAVAKLFQTAGPHVERSIRGAILDAWQKRDDRIWQLYFPPDSNGKLAKPTNAVFISRIADGLRISLNTSQPLEFIPAECSETSGFADCLPK